VAPPQVYLTISGNQAAAADLTVCGADAGVSFQALEDRRKNVPA